MRAKSLAVGILAGLVSLLVIVAPTRAAADFDSAYVFESAYLGSLAPGDTGTFAVFFMNTGNLTWSAGTSTQVNLGICLPDKVTCSVESTRSAWNPGSWPS